MSDEATKRRVIYIGERLKEISAEIARLNQDRETIASLDQGYGLEEQYKRRHIYIVDRTKELMAEKEALLATKQSFGLV